MFTGIIETTGKVLSVKKKGSNLQISIASPLAKGFTIGQSIAHNGVCLTVESKNSNTYLVTAVKETLLKTNLGTLQKGDLVNLERSLKIGDRLDGHFVQGHVDTTAACTDIKKEKGSWIFKFQVSSSTEVSNLLIDKGSVCINGVSLTVVETKGTLFSVAIIPHTFKHTNFCNLKKNDRANIEFDVLGKYIQKNIRTSAGHP